MRHKNQSNEFIKDCIASSYVELLYERNKEDISITDICHKSGFGRTTYYRHFGNDKNQLLVYIGKKRWEDYKNKNKEKVSRDEGFEFIVHCYNNKKFMLMLRNQNMIDPLFQILFEIYGAKQTEDQALRYVKDLYVGMVFGIIYDWISMGCFDRPEEIKNKIGEGFASAIQKEKEKKQGRE